MADPRLAESAAQVRIAASWVSGPRRKKLLEVADTLTELAGGAVAEPTAESVVVPATPAE